MSNLDFWNKAKGVPSEAKKTIAGGRLKGMTDINPMWRLKVLTEQFGLCGVGWRYEIREKRLEVGSNESIAAFVDIDLYIRDAEGNWSMPIPGTGGSMFVTKESNGMYTSDECFKMALTDAISVACKALGIGADVYWDKDKTKYTTPFKAPSEAQVKELESLGGNLELASSYFKKEVNDITAEEVQSLIDRKKAALNK